MTLDLRNHVRRERLLVDAATPELAMKLRPRLGDLNRRALLPVIEAVLAELAPPGRQVRIDRLELDLGDVPAARLEEELPRRLEAELRRAVAAALRGGADDPAPGVAWRVEARARVELLERHLARGTLPSWAPHPAPSLEELVLETAGAEPDVLAATVRRLGRLSVVLHRLTVQLRDAALASLVKVLEPVHAALVLAYALDLRRVHRREPLLPLGEVRFARLLWLLVLTYLVRDPGSQFNRKSFVRSLLRGMSMDQGVDYAALLSMLRTGLARTRRHRAARSSLPAVVAELLRDLEHGDPSASLADPESDPDDADDDRSPASPVPDPARPRPSAASGVIEPGVGPHPDDWTRGDAAPPSALAADPHPIDRGIGEAASPSASAADHPLDREMGNGAMPFALAASPAHPFSARDRARAVDLDDADAWEAPAWASFPDPADEWDASVDDSLDASGARHPRDSVGEPPRHLGGGAVHTPNARAGDAREASGAGDASDSGDALRVGAADPTGDRAAGEEDLSPAAARGLAADRDPGAGDDSFDAPGARVLHDLHDGSERRVGVGAGDASGAHDTNGAREAGDAEHPPDSQGVSAIDQAADAQDLAAARDARDAGDVSDSQDVQRVLAIDRAADTQDRADEDVPDSVDAQLADVAAQAAHRRDRATGEQDRAAGRDAWAGDDSLGAPGARELHDRSGARAVADAGDISAAAADGVDDATRAVEADSDGGGNPQDAAGPGGPRSGDPEPDTWPGDAGPGTRPIDAEPVERPDNARAFTGPGDPRSKAPSAQAGPAIDAPGTSEPSPLEETAGVGHSGETRSPRPGARASLGGVGPGARRPDARRDPARQAMESARPLLDRYDLAEALTYLLRHGVLPWNVALRDPGLDAAAVASALPGLPQPLFLAALHADSREERHRMLTVLARWLPDDGLARLLTRLIPWAEKADTPFRAALARFAAEAVDRRAFLLRVVGAALDGTEIDLEALAVAPAHVMAEEVGGRIAEDVAGGMAGEPYHRREDTPPGESTVAASSSRSSAPRPAELESWPAHLLASLLTQVLRDGSAHHVAQHGGEHEGLLGLRRAVPDPSPAELLAALAAAHPADARHYLRALGAGGEAAATLARSVPESLHGRLVELLDPAAVKTVGALRAALAALPAPERRFSADELRQVLLVEMMRLGDGEAPGEDFFSRVLGRLYGARLPGAAGERLLASTQGWVHPAGVPAPQVEAFRAAVATASGGEPRVRPAPASARERPRGAEARRELREAVFAFLLGREPGDASPAVPLSADGGSRAAGLSAEGLQHLLQRMVEESPDEIYPFLRRHSADRRVRERWVQVLAEPALVRLSQLLGPRHYASLLDAAEMLAAAWLEAAPPGHPALAGRAEFWGFLFDFLARNAGADRLTERLVDGFFADRAARCRGLSPQPDLAGIGARLMEAAGRLAHARGNARLRGILQRRRERLLGAWSPLAPPPPPDGAHDADPTPSADLLRQSAVALADSRRGSPRGGAPSTGDRATRRRPAFSLEGMEEAEDEGEPIYVSNAGLVLTGPFLPHLFAQLELLGKDEAGHARMRDADAASRAVHLLQYLVDGSTDTAEPLLVLNKVLCGIPLEAPVDRAIELETRERELCDRLLAAMLAAWTPLNRTSSEGLQETFLRREGRLDRHKAGGWGLTVQRKTLDVLVDQVPWSVSIVYHEWMPEPLHVTW